MTSREKLRNFLVTRSEVYANTHEEDSKDTRSVPIFSVTLEKGDLINYLIDKLDNGDFDE